MSDNRHKRFKGFTLIEIIVVMALSGIILALALKVILTLGSIASLQNKNSSQNNDIIILHTILEENFMNSSKIYANENEELIFPFTDRRPVRISFQPSSVTVLNGISQDTISVHCEDLSIRYLVKESSLVEGVSFDIYCNDLIFPFSFQKQYPNQVKFNMDK